MRVPSFRGGTLASVLAALVACGGCGFFAVKLAPKKTARRSETDLASKARAFFHESLAAGRYESLPEATRLLTAAYLQEPRDPSLAFLLGMALPHVLLLAARGSPPEADRAGARARQALRGRSEAVAGHSVPVLHRLRGLPRDEDEFSVVSSQSSVLCSAPFN